MGNQPITDIFSHLHQCSTLQKVTKSVTFCRLVFKFYPIIAQPLYLRFFYVKIAHLKTLIHLKLQVIETSVSIITGIFGVIMMIDVSGSTSILKKHISETEQKDFNLEGLKSKFLSCIKVELKEDISLNTKKDTAFKNDDLANLDALIVYLAKYYALGKKSDINTKIKTTYLKAYLRADFLNTFAMGMCEVLFKNEYQVDALFHHACVVIFANFPKSAQPTLANSLLEVSMHYFGGEKNDGTNTCYWMPTEDLTILDHPFFLGLMI